MKLYRGTQLPEVKGRHKLTSWTPSLPVAVIYSARPADIFGGRWDPEFLEGSTIHMADLKADAKILQLCKGYHDCSWQTLMESLDYGKPNGITRAEAKRVLHYLHNRLTGKAPGGDFNYKVLDLETEPIEGERLDMMETVDWLHGESLITYFRDLEFEEFSPTGGVTLQLVADTFIFADAPKVRTVAKRLGYDALQYDDLFVGGDSAAEKLLGCEEIEDVPGIRMEWDTVSEDEDLVPTQVTIRPLHQGVLTNLRSVPVQEVLEEARCEVAANPSTPKRKLKARLLG